MTGSTDRPTVPGRAGRPRSPRPDAPLPPVRRMKLRALRLHGFKSFADRTEIAFNDGITAIVGPNGCGKSNISDAIRWVLGEQRPTAIRGGKMEEVIFQGTVNRRPVNRGSVSIEVTNEDGALALPFGVVDNRQNGVSGRGKRLLPEPRGVPPQGRAGGLPGHGPRRERIRDHREPDDRRDPLGPGPGEAEASSRRPRGSGSTRIGARRPREASSAPRWTCSASRT